MRHLEWPWTNSGCWWRFALALLYACRTQLPDCRINLETLYLLSVLPIAEFYKN